MTQRRRSYIRPHGICIIYPTKMSLRKPYNTTEKTHHRHRGNSGFRPPCNCVPVWCTRTVCIQHHGENTSQIQRQQRIPPSLSLCPRLVYEDRLRRKQPLKRGISCNDRIALLPLPIRLPDDIMILSRFSAMISLIRCSVIFIAFLNTTTILLSL